MGLLDAAGCRDWAAATSGRFHARIHVIAWVQKPAAKVAKTLFDSALPERALSALASYKRAAVDNLTEAELSVNDCICKSTKIESMTLPQEIALERVEQLADAEGHVDLRQHNELHPTTIGLLRDIARETNDILWFPYDNRLQFYPKGRSMAADIRARKNAPSPSLNSEPTHDETAGAFLVLGSIASPNEWAFQFCKGMVVAREDFTEGLSIRQLIQAGAIRPATGDEIERFQQDYPSTGVRDETADAFKKSLKSELRQAKLWSAKAALCRKWIERLMRMNEECLRSWGSSSSGVGLLQAASPSEQEMVRFYVTRTREAKKAHEPRRVLRAELRSIAESLLVEAEDFSDLPSTPLMVFLPEIESNFVRANSHLPALDYLTRLRFKFLNREPRPGLVSWVNHHRKKTVAFLLGLGTVAGVVTKVVHDAEAIRDDLRPSTQPTTNKAISSEHTK